MIKLGGHAIDLKGKVGHPVVKPPSNLLYRCPTHLTLQKQLNYTFLHLLMATDVPVQLDGHIGGGGRQAAPERDGQHDRASRDERDRARKHKKRSRDEKEKHRIKKHHKSSHSKSHKSEHRRDDRAASPQGLTRPHNTLTMPTF